MGILSNKSINFKCQKNRMVSIAGLCNQSDIRKRIDVNKEISAETLKHKIKAQETSQAQMVAPLLIG
ncbi:hypothetical protein D3C76_1590990 [compost metagenome]